MAQVAQSTGFYTRLDLFSTELRNGFLIIPISILISTSLILATMTRSIQLQERALIDNQAALDAVLPLMRDILYSIDNLELVLNADNLNLTLDLDKLESTAANILTAVETGNTLTDDIFNSETGWGASVKANLEEADDILGAVSDSLDIVKDIIDTVSTIIQGLQQQTLTGILESLQAGSFDAKVYRAIAEAEFSLEATTLEMASLEAEALETAAVLLDACVSVLGEGPIECVGGEFAEFAIEVLAAEGLTAQAVKLFIPINSNK